MSIRRSREEMFSLIEQWEKGAEKRETFCRSHGVTLGTFSYWRSKYRKETIGEGISPFIKLQPQTPLSLEILYPNGVILRLPEQSALSHIRALIQLV